MGGLICASLSKDSLLNQWDSVDPCRKRVAELPDLDLVEGISDRLIPSFVTLASLQFCKQNFVFGIKNHDSFSLFFHLSLSLCVPLLLSLYFFLCLPSFLLIFKEKNFTIETCKKTCTCILFISNEKQQDSEEFSRWLQAQSILES